MNRILLCSLGGILTILLILNGTWLLLVALLTAIEEG